MDAVTGQSFLGTGKLIRTATTKTMEPILRPALRLEDMQSNHQPCTCELCRNGRTDIPTNKADPLEVNK